MNKIITALLKAQSGLHNLSKNAKGYGYEYLTLDKLIDETRDVLTENGLVIVQTLDQGSLVTTIYHESGESISSSYLLQEVQVGKANAAQQYGAAITYARRYSLAAILNIAQADDDANGAPDAKNRQPKPPAKPKYSEMQSALIEAIKGRKIDGKKWMDEQGIQTITELSDNACADFLSAVNGGQYDD